MPKKQRNEFFDENDLSGIRLQVAGLLVDFDFVCWCSRGPTHYALSATANCQWKIIPSGCEAN